MAHATQPRGGLAIGEINTTPLIDVMLVLLIMFIMTIPAANHSLTIDLPNCGRDCGKLPPINPVRNRLAIDAQDRLFWNGNAVSERQLAWLLDASTRLRIEPELQFEPAALASYDIAARTLRTIKASGITKFGFLGNERYRRFRKADD